MIGVRHRIVFVVLLLAIVGLPACSSNKGSGAGRNGEDGVTELAGSDVAARLDSIPKGRPSADEIAGMVRMREEELLARDIYLALGDRWGTKVFANISSAEQTHADAVKALLDRYSIDDPSADHTSGTFTDPELQSLYSSLLADGSRSLVDALTVGATVEELDLADLAARATDIPDIAWVYTNLERGSRNHLRAFVRQLGRNGAEFTPSYIAQSDFDSIISSDTERGSEK